MCIRDRCFLVYNLVNLFNGVLYDELLLKDLMTKTQFFFVVIGLLGVLFGVVMISWDSALGPSERSSKEDSETLLYAKFPYLQTSHHVKLSFEESELLKQLQL